MNAHLKQNQNKIRLCYCKFENLCPCFSHLASLIYICMYFVLFITRLTFLFFVVVVVEVHFMLAP